MLRCCRMDECDARRFGLYIVNKLCKSSLSLTHRVRRGRDDPAQGPASPRAHAGRSSELALVSRPRARREARGPRVPATLIAIDLAPTCVRSLTLCIFYVSEPFPEIRPRRTTICYSGSRTLVRHMSYVFGFGVRNLVGPRHYDSTFVRVPGASAFGVSSPTAVLWCRVWWEATP